MPLKDRLREILNQIFDVGFSHETESDFDAKEKLIAFLQEVDHITALDDDLNVRIARATLRYLIADMMYEEDYNLQRAYEQMESFFERMMKTDSKEWHYYELKLVISSLQLTKSLEQAEQLATKAWDRINQFRAVRITKNLESARATNMCARLLHAKIFDPDVEIDGLTTQFYSYFEQVRELAEQFKHSEFLEMMLLVTNIRRDIFSGDGEIAFNHCDELAARYGEKIGEMLDSEVKFYMKAGAFSYEEVS